MGLRRMRTSYLELSTSAQLRGGLTSLPKHAEWVSTKKIFTYSLYYLSGTKKRKYRQTRGQWLCLCLIHLWTAASLFRDITRPPILSAVPLYWSTLCAYLPRSSRRAAVWQLWRSPKPTPLQSRRTPARPKCRSLLWKLHQLEAGGGKKKSTVTVKVMRMLFLDWCSCFCHYLIMTEADLVLCSF